MSVIIRKYPDKLVFINPGTIILGKEQMLRGGVSKPRNKLILNMLNYIGVGERAGSGVPDIYKIWAMEKYEDPEVEEVSGRDGTIHTIVTLPLINKESSAISTKTKNGAEDGAETVQISGRNKEQTDIEKQKTDIETGIEQQKTGIETGIEIKLTDTEKSIIEVMMKIPQITITDIAASIGMARSGVQYAIDNLKKKNVLKREGSTKKGTWVVADVIREQIYG